MEIRELFEEFIQLGWGKLEPKKTSLYDIHLGNYSIARHQTSGLNIYNLANGNNLYISWKWLCIFSSFNTFIGDRIKLLKESENDEIEHTILLFHSIVRSLDNRIQYLLLDAVGKIKSTKEFRDWCEEKFNLSLDPVEVWTLNDNRML